MGNRLLSFMVLLIGMTAATHAERVRIATFNIKELDRAKLDSVDPLGRGADPQLCAAAAIVQMIRPDVLVVNEIDFDFGARANARLFVDRYLRNPQGDRIPVDYQHIVFLPTNTGVPSGLDLDRDGSGNGPEDAWGFGRYPGQYGMALLSRLPIRSQDLRSFRRFPWRAMPGNLMPDGNAGKPDWYGSEAAARLRLSSKSHWDVPLEVGGEVWHLLVSHPTPPVFDGDEDRNGRRNFDELRLWADYISGDAAGYLVDDRGQRGPLPPDASFIIVGDLNADPVLGSILGQVNAIGQLLGHPRVRDPRPRSTGAAAVAREYPGEKALRTASFGRADYVLPSRDLEVEDSGVYWPGPGERGHELALEASDHRLVWIDLTVPP